MRTPTPTPTATAVDVTGLERRGRRWLIVSFLACPCHLPLTLAVLAGVLGGTALGALLREHTVLAGTLVGAAWLAGTARGLLLIRRAGRAGSACPMPTPPAARAG
jgi:mercuric ion transport protein